MKVVINRCYGGFAVSEAVYKELGVEWDGYGYLYDYLGLDRSEPALRSDPKLIAAIEKIGLDAASGSLAELVIVEIPDGIEFEIEDYDGMESIHESHRSWS